MFFSKLKSKNFPAKGIFGKVVSEIGALTGHASETVASELAAPFDGSQQALCDIVFKSTRLRVAICYALCVAY